MFATMDCAKAFNTKHPFPPVEPALELIRKQFVVSITFMHCCSRCIIYTFKVHKSGAISVSEAQGECRWSSGQPYGVAHKKSVLLVQDDLQGTCLQGKTLTLTLSSWRRFPEYINKLRHNFVIERITFNAFLQ